MGDNIFRSSQMTLPTMSLEQIQREMARAVMTPLTPEEEMRKESPEGDSMERIATSFIAPNSRLSSFERLILCLHLPPFVFRLHNTTDNRGGVA